MKDITLLDEFYGRLVAAYPDQRNDIQAVFKRIKGLEDADQAIVLGAMDRYVNEAMRNSYRTRTRGLIKLMLERKWLRGCDAVVDLGAGSGDFIRELRTVSDVPALGIDLSPGFVDNFNRRDDDTRSCMRMDLIDCPVDDTTIWNPNLCRRPAVFSTLTADRTCFPRTLIANMGNFKGPKVLATLLPINPEDDNPSIPREKRRIYTQPKNRVVPGTDKLEDGGMLKKYLKTAWQAQVTVDCVDYEVDSGTDTQTYQLYVFSSF